MILDRCFLQGGQFLLDSEHHCVVVDGGNTVLMDVSSGSVEVPILLNFYFTVMFSILENEMVCCGDDSTLI